MSTRLTTILEDILVQTECDKGSHTHLYLEKLIPSLKALERIQLSEARQDERKKFTDFMAAMKVELANEIDGSISKDQTDAVLITINEVEKRITNL